MKNIFFVIIAAIIAAFSTPCYSQIKEGNLTVVRSYTVNDISFNGSRVSMNGYYGVESDFFVYGLTNVLSDKFYLEPIYVAETNAYTYTTIAGASRRIPAFRILSPEELNQKNYALTNRIFYISEMQASNNIAHKIKLPKGYSVFVTNGVSTNLFKP